MKTSKLDKVRELIADIKADNSCTLINPPLVNQFALHTRIPNRWFDWENRVNSPIMIVGQDWGPYVHLKKYIDDPSKDHLASSRTEKFIINALDDINSKLIDTIFFTVAIVFTRGGNLFRGSQNYNESKSFGVSFPYVSRQIDIVQPKIIMTLGGLAFKVINCHFNLGFESMKLSEIVELGEIRKRKSLILPAYHPASFVSPEIQIKSWKRLKAIISRNGLLV